MGGQIWEEDAWGPGSRRGTYPGIVEFGLDAYHFAFFLILGAEDIELGGVEGSVCVSRRGLAMEDDRGWIARFLGWTYVSASRASAQRISY